MRSLRNNHDKIIVIVNNIIINEPQKKSLMEIVAKGMGMVAKGTETAMKYFYQ